MKLHMSTNELNILSRLIKLFFDAGFGLLSLDVSQNTVRV